MGWSVMAWASDVKAGDEVIIGGRWLFIREIVKRPSGSLAFTFMDREGYPAAGSLVKRPDEWVPILDRQPGRKPPTPKHRETQLPVAKQCTLNRYHARHRWWSRKDQRYYNCAGRH